MNWNAIKNMWKVIDGKKCTLNGLRLDKKILRFPDEFLEWTNTGSFNQVNELFGDKLLKLRSENTKVNKYLIKMFSKLQQYAIDAEQEKFERLTWILMKHSKSMRWLALQNTMPDWNKRLSLHKVSKIMKLVGKAMYYYQHDFKSVRVMIPKEDGTFRPLSVPTLKWRIISQWYLMMFRIWVDQSNIICKRQFATIKNGGTAQAWNYVWNNVLNKQYIFEFDIAQCFNSILWHEVWNKVMEIHTPKNIGNWIYSVMAYNFHNTSIESFDKEEFERLDKIYNTNPRNMWDAIKEGGIDPVNTMKWATKGDFLKRLDVHTWKDILDIKWKLNKHKNWITMSDKQKNMLDLIPKVIFENMEQQSNARGLPQGWALSPILTDLVLSDVAVDFPGVYYLDDGVLASDSIEEISPSKLRVRLQELGLSFKEGKCKWIRIGRWLENPLRFLGATYSDGKWFASTKRGASVEMSLPQINKNFYSGKPKRFKIDLKTFIRNYGCTQLLAYMYNDGFVFKASEKELQSLNKLWDRLFLRFNLGNDYQRK